MLIVDVIVKIVLNRYVRISKAVVSLYNLDVEHLCAASKDTREHYIKLFLFNINLLTDTKEDLNLII
jgi:hypothetical protein